MCSFHTGKAFTGERIGVKAAQVCLSFRIRWQLLVSLLTAPSLLYVPVLNSVSMLRSLFLSMQLKGVLVVLIMVLDKHYIFSYTFEMTIYLLYSSNKSKSCPLYSSLQIRSHTKRASPTGFTRSWNKQDLDAQSCKIWRGQSWHQQYKYSDLPS